MESNILFEDSDEDSAEQSFVSSLDSFDMYTDDEIFDLNFDQLTIEDEEVNQCHVETDPCLKEEDEQAKSLFSPFNHRMIPDPEYICLLSQQSASNQEAVTKCVNERFKLILKASAMRKEREEKFKKHETTHHPLSMRLPEEVIKTDELPPSTIDDVVVSAQILQNLCATAGSSVAKVQSEESLSKVMWHAKKVLI